MFSLRQDTPVTNREISLRRLGGDETLLATLAGFFLEDAPALMIQLNHAHDSGDFAMVAHCAHGLKGLSATFEAVPFMQLAAEIESLARAEDHYHVNEAIPRLQAEFDRLAADLRSLVS